MPMEIETLCFNAYPPPPRDDDTMSPVALMSFFVFGDLCIAADDTDAREEFVALRTQYCQGSAQPELHWYLPEQGELPFLRALQSRFIKAGCGVDEIARIVAEHANIGEQNARARVLERLTDVRFTGIDPVEYGACLQLFMETRLFLFALNELWPPVLASPSISSKYPRIARDYKQSFLRHCTHLYEARKQALVGPSYTLEPLIARMQAMRLEFNSGVAVSKAAKWPPFVLLSTADFCNPMSEMEELASAYIKCRLDMMAAFCHGIRSVPPARKTEDDK